MTRRWNVSGEGGGKGGGASRGGKEAPNTLQTKNIASILYLIGEGLNGGLENGLESVFINDTPVLSASGTYNYKGIEVHENRGEPDPLPVPGFDVVENEQPVGSDVTVLRPVVRRITDSNVDSVRIKILFPSLLFLNKESGAIQPTTVQFTIAVRPVASVGEAIWKTAHDIEINDKTNSAQQLSWRVFPPEGSTGEWEWRVLRITPDTEESNLQNKIQVSSVTHITDGRLTYPYSHVIGVIAEAEQFGEQIPEPSFAIRGMSNLQLPSNYHADTKVYEDGIWDGTFITGWSDNPAWIFYAVLTNELWGIGRYLSSTQTSMLKWDCYEIGKFCDESVPDGTGGTEARFTCNGVIHQQSDALDLLAALTSTFRGMMYWAAGGILVSSDRPKNTSPLLVTQANVQNGNFERPGVRNRDRVTSVKVVWNDPEDAYRQTIEVAEDDVAIRRFGLRTAQLAAFMCSSRGQAQRVGRWVLASQVLEPVIFRGGRDLSELRPGDIARIADPDHAAVRAGGRVTGLMGDGLSGFYVDQYEFPFPQHISVRLTSGAVERKEISADSFTGTQAEGMFKLKVTEPFSAPPQVGAVWVGETMDVAPEMVRVLNVEELEGGVFQFECITYLPTLFADVDRTGTFVKPSTSLIPTGDLPVPVDISITESLVASGPTVSGIADISWAAPGDIRIRRTQIEIARPYDSYKPLEITDGPTTQAANISAGAYKVRLRFLDGYGRGGVWAEVNKQLHGLTELPPALKNIRLARAGGLAILSWDPVTVLDVKIGGKIIVRFAERTGGIATSNHIIDPLAGSATQAIIPSVKGTFYIFARDSGGRAGAVRSINSSAATVLQYSPVAKVRADPVWSGIHSGTEKSGTLLRLSSDSSGVLPEGLYIMSAGIDLGSEKRVRLESSINTIGVNTNDSLIERKGNMLAFENMFGIVFDETDAVVEVRTTGDDPSRSYDVFNFVDVFARADIYAADSDAKWSAWEQLLVGEYNIRGVEGRIRLFSNDASYRIDCSKFEINATEVAA